MSVLGKAAILGSRLFADLAVCLSDDFSWPANPIHPKHVQLGSDQEIRQASEECQRYFVPEIACM